MSFQTVLCIGIGGFFGTLARYFAGLIIGTPLATLTVNVLGSLAIGFVLGSDRWTQSNLAIVTIGLLGGFTTFSAFSAESIAFVKAGQPFNAIAYIAITLFLGLGATYLGFVLAEF